MSKASETKVEPKEKSFDDLEGDELSILSRRIQLLMFKIGKHYSRAFQEKTVETLKKRKIEIKRPSCMNVKTKCPKLDK